MLEASSSCVWVGVAVNGAKVGCPALCTVCRNCVQCECVLSTRTAKHQSVCSMWTGGFGELCAMHCWRASWAVNSSFVWWSVNRPADSMRSSPDRSGTALFVFRWCVFWVGDIIAACQGRTSAAVHSLCALHACSSSCGNSTCEGPVYSFVWARDGDCTLHRPAWVAIASSTTDGRLCTVGRCQVSVLVLDGIPSLGVYAGVKAAAALLLV